MAVPLRNLLLLLGGVGVVSSVSTSVLGIQVMRINDRLAVLEEKEKAHEQQAKAQLELPALEADRKDRERVIKDTLEGPQNSATVGRWWR